MVAHNLREFLGDSLFSHAVKQLIATNTFGNYDANSLRNPLRIQQVRIWTIFGTIGSTIPGITVLG
jgi:hypothetical protein